MKYWQKRRCPVMNKRHVTRNFLIVVVIAFISLTGQNCLSSTKNKKVIRVIFDMNPATIRYKDGEKIPVFKFDPRKDITASLKKAGFRVVSQDSKNYDLTLKINHIERARQTGRYSGDLSHKIMIDHIAFVLEDKDGAILLKEGRGPFGTYESMTAVKQSFVKDLPKLVIHRLQAKDEVSFQISLLKTKGFDKKRFERLSELKDPRAIEAITPFLRECYAPNRWYPKFVLWDLGYNPEGVEERAVFDIVDLVRPFRGHREKMDRARKIKKNVRVILAYYGLTAIELFLEDLTCEVMKNYYEGDAASKNAKKALNMLTLNNWRKGWGRGVVYLDRFSIENITYLSTEEVKKRLKITDESRRVNRSKFVNLYDPAWNIYAVKQLINALKQDNTPIKDKVRYLKDVIEILGTIADNRAIDSLKNYLGHPELAENAKKAIEEIEKRGK